MSTDRIETADEIMAALAKRDAALQSYAMLTRSVAADDGGWLQAAMSATGEVLVKMRAELRKEFKDQLEREVLALRNEFLRDRLDEARGVKRLKVVPQDTLVG